MSVGKFRSPFLKRNKKRPNNIKITHTHTPLHLELEHWKSKELNTSIFPITNPSLQNRLPCTCRCNSGWLEHHGLTQGTFSLEDLPHECFQPLKPLGFVRRSKIAEEGSTYNVPKRFGLEGFLGDFLGYFLVSYRGADQWKISYAGASGYYSIHAAQNTVLGASNQHLPALYQENCLTASISPISCFLSFS